MKKFFITTAIDYVNAPPHIGHALEKSQADVIARLRRQKGEEVFFLTGADEHGGKILKAAKEAEKEPPEFVDELSEKFKELKRTLNLSWDDFIRTSDKKRHWPAVFEIWKRLKNKGDLEKRKYHGLYCVGCEAFKNPKEFIDAKCPEHLTEPEKIEEENYFFKLSKYAGEIESRIKNNELRIIPESRKNEILSFINQGLADISVSRPKEKLAWGIPAPDDESQIIYVWIDALINYISALGFGSPQNVDILKFQRFWPADVHFIGKDILRFHTVIWPAMLLSADLPLPKTIFAHGFITVNGQKMSKTLGNIVSPFELTKKYGADATRYYLLREIPAYDDGDFTEEKFKEKYNADLANGLGNFTARVLALAEGDPNLRIHPNLQINPNIREKIEKIQKSVAQKLEEFKFNEALAAIWELISFGDNYVNETKAWSIKDEKTKTEVLSDLIAILVGIADLLKPFLPQTSEKILSRITRAGDSLQIKKGEILFPRV
jgi:methionyl-tRNA synthetase